MAIDSMILVDRGPGSSTLSASSASAGRRWGWWRPGRRCTRRPTGPGRAAPRTGRPRSTTRRPGGSTHR
eukprot:14653163-Alexandrium_andersonii.AAC.1